MKNLIYNPTLRNVVKAVQGVLAGLLVLCLLTVRSRTGNGGLAELGRSFEQSEQFFQTVEQIIDRKIGYVRNKELFERDGSFDENRTVDIRQYSSGIMDEANLNVNTAYYIRELLEFAGSGAPKLEARIRQLQSQGKSEQEIGQILSEESSSLEEVLPVSGATLSDYARMSPNPAVTLLGDYRDLYEAALDISQRYEQYTSDSEMPECENSPDAPSNIRYYVENTSTKERYTNLRARGMKAAREALSGTDFVSVFEGERRFNIMVADTEADLNEEAAVYFMNTRFVGSGEKVLIAADLSYAIGDALQEAHRRHQQMRPVAFACAGLAVACAMLLPLLLFFSVLLTGKTQTGAMRPLSLFDQIPTEIAGGIVTIAVISWWMLGRFLGRGRSGAAVFWMSALFAGVEYLILLWAVLSGVRRLRAGMLWENSVSRAVLMGARAVYSARQRTQRVALLFLGYLALSIVLLKALGLPGLLLYLVMNMLVWLYLMQNAAGNQNVREGLRQISKGKLDYRIRTEVLTGESREMGEAVNEMGEGLQKAVDSMLKNERLRAELITNVSHDLKTPLTSILNYVDLLRREQLANPRAQEYVRILEQKAGRLKQLTEDLIEVSRISSGNVELHPVRLRLQSFIWQAAGEFEDRFEQRQLKLQVDMPKEPVEIMADGAQLWRIFENLLGNMVKYARGETQVRLILTREEGRAVISFENISDEEITMTAQELQERFTRGDRSRGKEGSGLGLSIAGSLAQLMGGEFAVELRGEWFIARASFPAEPEEAGGGGK